MLEFDRGVLALADAVAATAVDEFFLSLGTIFTGDLDLCWLSFSGILVGLSTAFRWGDVEDEVRDIFAGGGEADSFPC